MKIHKIGLSFILVLTLYSVWQTRPSDLDKQVMISAEPQGIMGTSCRLAIIVKKGAEDHAYELLQAAEQELRDQERIFSTWMKQSELSLLNSAEPGSIIEISDDLRDVLLASKKMFDASNQAFDVSSRPLFSLWRKMGKQGIIPSDEAISSARASSDWSMIQMDQNQLKKGSTVEIDLSGIAKGYAIDQALARLESQDTLAGMVDVGGDIKAFGEASEGWSIYLKDPYSGELSQKLTVKDQAVCTSGDYARFVEIQGKRFSHILNPITGYPVEKSSSITVVGSSAMLVDAWATALSVMGEEGLQYLPEGYEAMMIIGTEDDFELRKTAGFSFYEE